MRASSTEVREFESPASVRIPPNGVLEISRMLRTGPRQAIPIDGTAVSPWRCISMTGTRPTSAAPDSTRRAHSLGTANCRSTAPRCGPWAMP